MSRKGTVAAFVLGAALLTVAIPAAQATPTNVRLTNDNSAYVSDYTLATGQPYTDDVLTACSQSRGRQNEPAIAVDPRNTNVVVGSSNDYCPVFNADGSLLGLGDIWLGYYRSENSGTSFTSSLVPATPRHMLRLPGCALPIRVIPCLRGTTMGACSQARRAQATEPVARRHSETSGSVAT
jgi:hypothetical protein